MPDDAPARTPPASDKAHRRRVLRVIVVTQLIVALLTGCAVAIGYDRLNGNIEAGQAIPHFVTPPAADPEKPNRPLNILVVGSDSRDGDNNIDGDKSIGARSDMTILVHVSADRKQAYGVSLPRDAVVDQPACTDATGRQHPAAQDVMFNDAFAVAGPTCTVKMVESLTGIYVDHYLVIDFGGFVDMVDAVHGVPVCIPEAVDDPIRNIHLAEGTREISGLEALNYVRERHVLSPNSDLGRMKRQQAFVAAMINKVISAGTLTHVNRVYDFLGAMTNAITPDPELATVAGLADLALQFRHTGLADIRFVTVPNEPFPADVNRLQWSAAAAPLWERILADEPLPRSFRDQAISAGDKVGEPGGTRSAEAAANGLCS